MGDIRISIAAKGAILRAIGQGHVDSGFDGTYEATAKDIEELKEALGHEPTQAERDQFQASLQEHLRVILPDEILFEIDIHDRRLTEDRNMSPFERKAIEARREQLLADHQRLSTPSIKS